MTAPSNPFQLEPYSDAEDVALIELALMGQPGALANLIKRHQRFIFNVALKMINHVQDAEDVTQEILIKLMVNLGAFNPAKGRFRTWLYRITFNHILNLKKQKYEQLVTGFDDFFERIENSPTDDLNLEEEVSWKLFIDEAKVACMAGMLMCLDREQRLIYIVGEIFEMDHTLASEIFDTSPANFRQKLSRARKDLYQWMNNRCGLVNRANACRCPKKTKGFIAKGWVNPHNLKWHSDYHHNIAQLSRNRIAETLAAVEDVYAALYREHPFKGYDKADQLLSTLLAHPTLKDVFRLG